MAKVSHKITPAPINSKLPARVDQIAGDFQIGWVKAEDRFPTAEKAGFFSERYPSGNCDDD